MCRSSAVLAALCFTGLAWAHHSAAPYFDANRLGLPSMMTVFDMEMLRQRIDQGYGWILMPMNDETADLVMAGREATGPQAN